MKKLILLVGFLSALQLTAQTPKVAQYITEKNIKTDLAFLANDLLEGRATGSIGIEKAAAYLVNTLKAYKVKPYFKSYYDTLTDMDKTAYNVVAKIEGNDAKLKKEWVVIGAHYDHIGRYDSDGKDVIFNGANDNASGTTAVLQLAKYFAKTKSNKRSLMIVFFTAEEIGLVGSSQLADKLKKQNFNLYTMLNFEMLGVPMQRDFKAYITGYKMSNLASVVNQFTKKNTIGFFPGEDLEGLFRRSDNAGFYDAFNVASHTFCTFDFENFSEYHGLDDEFEVMNTQHMTQLLWELTPGIEGIINTPKKLVQLN